MVSRASVVLAAALLGAMAPAHAWVGISPSGDVTIRDHTEVRRPSRSGPLCSHNC